MCTEVEEQRERKREGKNIRGKMTSSVGMRWQREQEKVFQVHFPSVDANAMLCFTRLDEHTWDGPVTQRDVQQGYWKGPEQLEFLILPFALDLSLHGSLRSNYCRPAVWSLRGPLVNQGPPFSGWIQYRCKLRISISMESINQQKNRLIMFFCCQNKRISSQKS